MRVTFVGHSSLVIWLGSSSILCDPWLSGRVFNSGWGLSPEPVFDHANLKDINYLWISHEHADHLHFATLKNFSEEFKSRVVVIFQKNNSDKVSAALRKIGYQHFLTVPHCKRASAGVFRRLDRSLPTSPHGFRARRGRCKRRNYHQRERRRIKRARLQSYERDSGRSPLPSGNSPSRASTAF